MILPLYRAASLLGDPLIRLYFARRRRRGREDPVRHAERRGVASLPRPAGPLAWLHAASVGEAISVLCLIERLRRDRPGLALLVTTGTVTSAAIMADRLPPDVLHQYAPADHPLWVRRFLDHWRPDLALWVESEFWPNLLRAIAARGVPLVLVNARISPRSYAGWMRLPRTIARLLGCFALCLAQSTADGDKLRALGAGNVRVPGNLKFAADALPVDAAELDRMRALLGARPVWTAISTHPGEEEAVAASHRSIAARHPGLLTVIVPRHPGRGAAIARDLAAAGHRVARRAAGEEIGPDTGIYIADTVGELGLFCRLAPIAFIGGSLVPHGGQNLLEAAKLGCAVLHGPSMANFAAIVEEMRAAGATETVGDAAGLAAAVDRLLGDAGECRRRIAAAAGVAAAKHGILDSVVGELAPFLDRIAPAAPPAATAARCHARS